MGGETARPQKGNVVAQSTWDLIITVEFAEMAARVRMIVDSAGSICLEVRYLHLNP